jgi:uncharacterized protein (TIGR00251 family)
METILRLKVSARKGKFKAVFNEDDEILFVHTKNNAQNGKANLEIINELSRILKTKVEIVSGFKNKNKILKIKCTYENVLKKFNTN